MIKMKTHDTIQEGLFKGFLGVFTKAKKVEKKNTASLAIRDLKLIDIERLLTEKHSFERDSYLMLTIKEKNKEAFEYLLPKGFDLFYKNASGYTLVHLIIRQGLMDYLKILEDSSGKNLMAIYISLDMQTNKGLTPLQIAIEENRTELIHYIIGALEKRSVLDALKSGFKSLKENLDITCVNKETALIKAVRLNNVPIAKLLISKGANVYATNKEGRNILHLTVLNCMKDFFQYMIYYDADKNLLRSTKDCKGKLPKDMDSQNLLGQLFKHVWDYCKNNEHKRVLRNLLESNLELVNKQTTFRKNTPLHVAVISEADEIVEMLINDFEANKKLKNRKGLTAIEIAKKSKATMKMRKILKAFANEEFKVTKEIAGKQGRWSKSVENTVAIIREKIEKKKISLEKLFKKLDTDGNGVLSVSEMECLFICLEIGVNSKQVREVISAADLNKDGTIDYKEFIHLLNPQKDSSKNDDVEDDVDDDLKDDVKDDIEDNKEDNEEDDEENKSGGKKSEDKKSEIASTVKANNFSYEKSSYNKDISKHKMQNSNIHENKTEIIYGSVYSELDNKKSNVKRLNVNKTPQDSGITKKEEDDIKLSSSSSIQRKKTIKGSNVSNEEDIHNAETIKKNKEDVSYQGDFEVDNIEESAVQSDKEEAETIEVKDDP